MYVVVDVDGFLRNLYINLGVRDGDDHCQGTAINLNILKDQRS